MKERKQFGKAIAEFQGLQFMIADMAIADRGGQGAHLPGRGQVRTR